LSCAPVFEPNGAFHGITANTPHLYRDAINHWSLVLVEVKAAIGCHPYLRAIFALLVTTLRCLGPTTPIYVQRPSRDPDPLAPKALTLPQLRLVPGARGREIGRLPSHFAVYRDERQPALPLGTLIEPWAD